MIEELSQAEGDKRHMTAEHNLDLKLDSATEKEHQGKTDEI
jgi:hypothetical protein